MAEHEDPLKALRIDRTQKAGSSGSGLRWLLIILILLLAGFGGWWWWNSNGREQTVRLRTAAVEVTGGDQAAGASVLDASGYVVARRRATVSSKITAKIVEVRIEEGMRVQEGEVLARLDDTLQQRQLALAEAQLTAARSNLKETGVRLEEAELEQSRASRLVANQVSPKAELDRADSEVEALQARRQAQEEEVAVAERQLAVRQQQLEDTVIRAPFDGVVVTKAAQPGEMISPVSAGGGFTRTGIGTVVDMTSLEVEVDVNEAYIQRVTSGQRVEAVLDAYPDWRIPARVITPVPTADRQKATVRVRIAFDQLDQRILPEMGVKVAFLGDLEERSSEEPEPKRLWVPQEALVEDAEGSYVFVLSDGRAQRRTVATGQSRGEQIEITSGLRGAERVLLSPPADLAEGTRIETP